MHAEKIEFQVKTKNDRLKKNDVYWIPGLIDDQVTLSVLDRLVAYLREHMPRLLPVLS